VCLEDLKMLDEEQLYKREDFSLTSLSALYMHLFSSKAVAGALFSPAKQKLHHCDMSLL